MKHGWFEEFSLIQEDGVFWLWGFGEYEESSVLAGQPRQARLEQYDTKEEAEKETGLKVGEGSVPMPKDMIPVMPTSAPSWFDPMDAGEAWGEDDY